MIDECFEGWLTVVPEPETFFLKVGQGGMKAENRTTLAFFTAHGVQIFTVLFVGGLASCPFQHIDESGRPAVPIGLLSGIARFHYLAVPDGVVAGSGLAPDGAQLMRLARRYFSIPAKGLSV